MAQKVRDLGIDVRILPLSSKVVDTRKDTLHFTAFLKLTSVFEIVKYAFSIAQLARKLKAEIIHSNSLKSDIYGGLAARIAAIPAVWHVRDRIDDQYLPKAAVQVFRLLCRLLPHAVIANSKSTLSCLSFHSRQTSAVVYECYNPKAYEQGLGANEAALPAVGCSPNLTIARGRSVIDPVVAVVGRIAEWKGQHVFIKAAEEVLKQHPNAQFWIVGAPLFGEHDYEKSLHHLVNSLGLQDSIHFLGFRTDISDILSKVTVMVHSSTLGEPFGRVVVEGMAAGKPVVATNGGALPEIIMDGLNGKLVPMNDSGAMAEAISFLLSDPIEAETIGHNGKQKVLDCFTLSQTARGVEKVYDLVLAAA